jgi:hypothetical protein
MHIQEPEPKQRETRCKFICRPNGKRWTVLWYVVLFRQLSRRGFCDDNNVYNVEFSYVLNVNVNTFK